MYYGLKNADDRLLLTFNWFGCVIILTKKNGLKFSEESSIRLVKEKMIELNFFKTTVTSITETLLLIIMLQRSTSLVLLKSFTWERLSSDQL